MNHVIDVAEILARIGGVTDADVLIAALLHDVVEDTPTTADEVAARFGSRVRALVVAGTSVTSDSGAITFIANPGAVAGSFSGITLTAATIGSASGNIRLQGQAGAGGGHGLLLVGSSVGQTGSGDVLLAGVGTLDLADIAWDTLTIAKSGGTYTFQDTVQGNQLIVLPGAYQVVFLDGGEITQAADFQIDFRPSR